MQELSCSLVGFSRNKILMVIKLGCEAQIAHFLFLILDFRANLDSKEHIKSITAAAVLTNKFKTLVQVVFDSMGSSVTALRRWLVFVALLRLFSGMLRFFFELISQSGYRSLFPSLPAPPFFSPHLLLLCSWSWIHSTTPFSNKPIHKAT